MLIKTSTYCSDPKNPSKPSFGILPPWLQYPTYTPNCSGFRMGSGEDYIDKWWTFWNGLPVTSQQQYINKFSPPTGWEMYVPIKNI